MVITSFCRGRAEYYGVVAILAVMYWGELLWRKHSVRFAQVIVAAWFTAK